MNKVSIQKNRANKYFPPTFFFFCTFLQRRSKITWKKGKTNKNRPAKKNFDGSIPRNYSNDG